MGWAERLVIRRRRGLRSENEGRDSPTEWTPSYGHERERRRREGEGRRKKVKRKNVSEMEEDLLRLDPKMGT